MWWNKIVNNENTAITDNQASKFIVSRSDNNFYLNLHKQWTHYLFGFPKIHVPVHHPFESYLG